MSNYTRSLNTQRNTRAGRDFKLRVMGIKLNFEDVAVGALGVFGIVLLVVATGLGMAALYGWIVMLLAGALHSFTPVPAFNFWQSVLIGVVLTFLAGLFQRND